MKKGVAVLGATGIIGQTIIKLLEDHPWFTVEALVASKNSAGGIYADKCRWILSDPMPESVKDMEIMDVVKDLDVLCEVDDFNAFSDALQTAYGHVPDFILSDFKTGRDGPYRTASFSHGDSVIEVFGQALPVIRQAAYRHMVIQARLLDLGGGGLRSEIIALRNGGRKTEPAFARRLGMAGDPYVALLALEEMDDSALRRLLDNAADTYGG